jgi:hypothetical protein
MVLQNKSDNSNGHALKWSNFRLNLSFCRWLSQKRTHFRENFMGNENFRETKFREILLIFASFFFSQKMEKTVFVSTLSLVTMSSSMSINPTAQPTTTATANTAATATATVADEMGAAFKSHPG